MTADDSHALHRRQAVSMIDAVELILADERLADLSRVSESALTLEERLRWRAWRRARQGELRVHHRLQVSCLILSGTVAAVAVLCASSTGNGPNNGPFAGFAALTAGVCLCAALLIEWTMTDRPGYQPWTLRCRLGHRARERVNLQPLRDSADDELVGGPRADEARLVIVARSITSAITAGDTWASEQLDAQNLRCDVNEVLARIARDAVNLRRSRRDGIPSWPNQPQVGGADDHAAIWESLVERLTWLNRYHRGLLALPPAAAGVDAPHPRNAAVTEPGVTDLRFTILALICS